TDESHTGEWIKELVKVWIEKIGFERFCAACSDSTGNTLLARHLLVEIYPNIFSLADICHHLDNTNKDLVKISFFDKTIKVIRGTISSFTKSHAGKSALQKAREELRIGAGLQAIGKTRFVTIILSALSVQRNIPAIKRALENSSFDFEYADYFPSNMDSKSKLKGRKFEDSLQQLIDIGLPIAKALTCMESNDANPADVFLFWHAVVFGIERIITDEDNGYPTDVQEQILAVLN
ncbi:hypothetical protein K435DRAFT_620867, partial [Dendrothele bispora CBS 962.96]